MASIIWLSTQPGILCFDMVRVLLFSTRLCPLHAPSLPLPLWPMKGTPSLPPVPLSMEKRNWTDEMFKCLLFKVPVVYLDPNPQGSKSLAEPRKLGSLLGLLLFSAQLSSGYGSLIPDSALTTGPPSSFSAAIPPFTAKSPLTSMLPYLLQQLSANKIFPPQPSKIPVAKVPQQGCFCYMGEQYFVLPGFPSPQHSTH